MAHSSRTAEHEAKKKLLMGLSRLRIRLMLKHGFVLISQAIA